MAPATLETWMIVSRRHRRQLFAFIFALILVQGALLSSHRSFFEHWQIGTPPPASFFAQTTPGSPFAPRIGSVRRFPFHRAGSVPPPHVGDDWVNPDFVMPPANQPADSPLQLPGAEFSLARFTPPNSSGGLGGPVGGPGTPGAPLDVTPARTNAVPESSTWIMMLIGFGLIGRALRIRPRQADPGLPNPKRPSPKLN